MVGVRQTDKQQRELQHLKEEAAASDQQAGRERRPDGTNQQGTNYIATCYAYQRHGGTETGLGEQGQQLLRCGAHCASWIPTPAKSHQRILSFCV